MPTSTSSPSNVADFLGGSLFNAILLLIVISLQGWILATGSTTGVGLEARCNFAFLGFDNNDTTTNYNNYDNTTSGGATEKEEAPEWGDDFFETNKDVRTPILPYNPNDPLPKPSSSKHNVTVGLCAQVDGNEASLYIDEWVDYHLLGVEFDELYLYDTSEDFVLQMWAHNRRQQRSRSITELEEEDEKNKSISSSSSSRDGRIHAIPFHEKEQKDFEIACLQEYGHRVSYMAVMRKAPDEFLVLGDEHETVADFLEDFRVSHTNALAEEATLPELKRFLFGTAMHQEYAPIPVLKRFQLRQVNNDGTREPFVMTKDLNVVGGTADVVAANDDTEQEPRRRRLQDKSNVADSKVASIYAFGFKSVGEWKKRGRDSAPLVGSVPDDRAWKRLTDKVPRYAKYNEWNDYF